MRGDYTTDGASAYRSMLECECCMTAFIISPLVRWRWAQRCKNAQQKLRKRHPYSPEGTCAPAAKNSPVLNIMRAGDAEIAKLLQEVGLIPRQLPCTTCKSTMPETLYWTPRYSKKIANWPYFRWNDLMQSAAEQGRQIKFPVPCNTQDLLHKWSKNKLRNIKLFKGFPPRPIIGFGHTLVNTPHPAWFEKLSTSRPG